MQQLFNNNWFYIFLMIGLLGGLLKADVDSPSVQANDDPVIWQDVFEATVARQQNQRIIKPSRYRLLQADIAALDAVLAEASSQPARQKAVFLTLPLPNGDNEIFQIEESFLMSPDLAAKFPTIKTYRGRSTKNTMTTIRLDRTPAGFHGIVFSSNGTVYIDPYQQHDITYYQSYYRQDYQNIWDKRLTETLLSEAPLTLSISPQQTETSSTILRTYRLAVAATGEYTQFHGGKTAAMAAIVTTINRVTAIFEREVAISFELVTENDKLIYEDPTTDPYSNNNNIALALENQDNIDRVIGSTEYDIGHVFSTNGGGLASLGSACQSGKKAQGVTGQPQPVGDPFDVDYVSHEFGHQFGAEHTYNASGARNCTTRVPSRAYEPGSGSTIMAYAGTCTDPTNPNINQDLQPHSDDYFHATSLDQIKNFVSRLDNSCGQQTTLDNNPPTVEAGSDWTIPHNTPFTLIGSGDDPDGDQLTYSWEQFDKGSAWTDAGTLPNTDQGNGPIFRSYPPITTTTRHFPAFNNPLALTGEALPTTNRTLNFRLTARDGQGGTGYDNTTVEVLDTAGPFQITSVDDNNIWSMGTSQTVTWDVANTNQYPFSCSEVDILLSVDGGLTFPITLANNVPNNGIAAINVPSYIAMLGVLKVACKGQIFFAKADIAICTTLLQDDYESGFGNWTTVSKYGSDTWQRQIDGGYSGQNYWFIPDSDDFSDSYLTSRPFTIAGDALFLRFFHQYDLEETTHGGRVELNINGEGWTEVTEDIFTVNRYNQVISTTGETPLANQWAFSGNSRGYIASVIDLQTMVTEGDIVEVRFRKSSDNVQNLTADKTGWSLDDVLICSNADKSPPLPSLAPTTEPTSVKVIILAGQAITFQPNDLVSVKLPTSMFDEAITLTYQELQARPTESCFNGFTFAITANNLGEQPAQSLTNKSYQLAVQVGTNATCNSLALYRQVNNETWQLDPTSKFDSDTGLITVTTDKFGTWALLPDTQQQIYLPLIISDLNRLSNVK